LYKLYVKCSLFKVFLYFCGRLQIIQIVKGLKSIFWFLFKCFAVYSIVVYALTFWVPSSHWICGFMMMSFPVTVLINLAFLVFWLLIDPKKALAPLFLIVLAGIFLDRTYQFKDHEDISSTKNGNARTFKVLNYNVFGFWVTQHHEREDDDKTNEMKKWLVSMDADVLVMPEFNNEDRIPAFRTTEFLKKAGYRYNNFLENKEDRSGEYSTLAVFSRFPIVKHEEIALEQQNGIMYTDVLVGKDTLRVIGVHLYSMSLRLARLKDQKEMAGVKRVARGSLAQIKRGFIERVPQTKMLEYWIKESPYAVILTGDFNETPYSYVYGKCRKLLNNAFEMKGEGFGFTYNRVPSFIRIDNQFFDDQRLDILDFQTLNNIKYSDHYPSIGIYQFKKIAK
jgi:endonuclease/exonuclease/phosphatase (EEP) superfamily protein YafD